MTTVLLFSWHFELPRPVGLSALLDDGVLAGAPQSIQMLAEEAYKYIKEMEISMNALLSIKPEFAEKILAGEKQYEFRRTTFRDASALGFVYLYATSPQRRIVGGFTIDRVVEGSPTELWSSFGDSSGIEERGQLLEYYEGVDTGYAIEIHNTYRLDEPIDPAAVFDEFSLRCRSIISTGRTTPNSGLTSTNRSRGRW